MVIVKWGNGKTDKGNCRSRGLEPTSKHCLFWNFQYATTVRRIVRSCLMRIERQLGDSLQRKRYQYLFLMLLRPLAGDMATAGIPLGVAERRCLPRPVIMTNTKCLSQRRKQKASGCSPCKLIQGSV